MTSKIYSHSPTDVCTFDLVPLTDSLCIYTPSALTLWWMRNVFQVAAHVQYCVQCFKYIWQKSLTSLFEFHIIIIMTLFSFLLFIWVMSLPFCNSNISKVIFNKISAKSALLQFSTVATRCHQVIRPESASATVLLMTWSSGDAGLWALPAEWSHISTTSRKSSGPELTWAHLSSTSAQPQSREADQLLRPLSSAPRHQKPSVNPVPSPPADPLQKTLITFLCCYFVLTYALTQTPSPLTCSFKALSNVTPCTDISSYLHAHMFTNRLYSEVKCTRSTRTEHHEQEI